MPVKASSILPSKALRDINSTCMSVQSQVDKAITKMAAATVSYTDIKTLYTDLALMLARLATASTTQGIVQYAKDQEDDPAYELVTELTITIDLIQVVLDWINTNLPLDVTLAADRDTVDVPSYTPAQSAGLRGMLSDISLSIT